MRTDTENGRLIDNQYNSRGRKGYNLDQLRSQKTFVTAADSRAASSGVKAKIARERSNFHQASTQPVTSLLATRSKPPPPLPEEEEKLQQHNNQERYTFFSIIAYNIHFFPSPNGSQIEVEIMKPSSANGTRNGLSSNDLSHPSSVIPSNPRPKRQKVSFDNVDSIAFQSSSTLVIFVSKYCHSHLALKHLLSLFH